MKKIHIAAQNAYDVILEAGSLKKAGRYILPYCKNRYAVIVTDDTVDALYGKTLETALSEEDIRTVKFVIPHGEKSKNAENFIRLLEFLAENHLTRSDLVIALGGGVVGDLAGFAAAVYLRGIAFVQVPTTLLAMVDSSVGGKTAIDLSQGKNLAGAFYQPKTVLCDPDVLESLPADIFKDGCAEVIKYGVLGDKSLFAHLLEKGTDFDRIAVLEACITMKSEIVHADEFDTGTRQLLNFGHTLGHAVEKASEFSLSHGKAVAIGMVMMAKSAEKEGLCPYGTAKEIETICVKFGLPTKTDESTDVLYESMLSDKKRQGDSINVVIPSAIGKCTLHKIEVSALLPFLQCGME